MLPVGTVACRVTQIQSRLEKGCRISLNMMEPGETKEIRVILIGKTGAGKSYLGNALLGREEFESSVLAESCTSKCAFGKQEVTSKCRKYILKIIDTPGFKDTRRPDDTTHDELVKCMSLALPGPHVFIIVVPIGKFTDEEFEVIEMLKREFGDKLMDFALVVFSHGSKLRNMSIEDYLKRASANLKQIVKESHNRYAVIGDDRDENFQKSVQDITDLIDDQNRSGHYTNEMFKKAEENKKLITARLEVDKSNTIKKLENEIKILEKREMARCDEEERKRIREEKLGKERELKKIKAISSAETYDVSVVNDNSYSRYTFAGICILGNIIAGGAGIMTMNPYVAIAASSLTTSAAAGVSLLFKDNSKTTIKVKTKKD